MCDIAVITERPLVETVISVIDRSGETVIDGLDYPEAGYI